MIIIIYLVPYVKKQEKAKNINLVVFIKNQSPKFTKSTDWVKFAETRQKPWPQKRNALNSSLRSCIMASFAEFDPV